MTDLTNQIERLSADAKADFRTVEAMIVAERALNGCLRDNLPQIVAALRAADEVEALRARVAELESALCRVAGKNDLSSAPDDELEAYASGALYECEMIAREALEAKP